MQSINLRAALLRALEQAKKNGILGRDAVVRKTMLDECRGDRLEEVLAVFSSAVLKKLAGEDCMDGARYPAVAQALALENRGYSGERTELDVLILAHRASLSGLLREKNAFRAKLDDLSELLGLKQRSIARRREQCRARGASGCSGTDEEQNIPDNAKLDVWRMVRNNWTGNERWMETLLYGDAASTRDGLLTAPYDRVWRRMESGRLTDLEDRNGGLLEQLDNRVRMQKSRLEQWEAFRKKIWGKSTEEPVKPDQKLLGEHRGVDLGFRAHENLHLGRLSPRKLPSKTSTRPRGEYVEMVEALESELQQIRQGSSSSFISALQSRRSRPRPPSQPPQEHLVAAIPGDDPISELSDLEEEDIEASVVLPPPESKHISLPGEPSISRPREQRGSISRPNTLSTIESTASSKPPRIITIAPPRPQLQSPPLSPIRSAVRTPSPTRPSTRYAEPQTPEAAILPTQQMADQILASMNNASPSPTKKPRHTLTLAERTRLSMGRGPRDAVLDEDDEPDFEALSLYQKRNSASIRSNGFVTECDTEGSTNDHEDLVTRTRRSMAGFEAARQKAQLERRRSQRKSRQISSMMGSRREDSSHFPAVDEGDSTLLLAEELMSAEQDDPEAIFRSRPKIKTSPIPSPTKILD